MSETINEQGDKKILKDTFWLDDFEGKCISGCYYRNNIGIAVREFEERFNRKIVGITIDRDSWNVEFILEEEKEQSK